MLCDNWKSIDEVVAGLLASRAGSLSRVARDLGLPGPGWQIEMFGREARLAQGLGVPDPLIAEAIRLKAQRDASVPPSSCGPEIVRAPARGPVTTVAPQVMMSTADGYAPQHGGFQGRDAARAEDAFDRMARQSQRLGHRPRLSRGEVQVGRVYAALVERYESSGLRCISVEATRVSGSGDVGYVDAVIADGQALRRMRAALGDDPVLEVRRETGRPRLDLRLRDLVDQVCLGGLTVTEVLRARGWSARGASVDQVYRALSMGLARMADVTPGLR